MRGKLVFLTMALWAQGAAAQSGAGAQEARPSGSEQVERLLACKGLPDAADRLACYDREAVQLAGAMAKREVVVVDREVVRETRRSLFGFATPARGLLAETPEDEITQLSTTITAARPYGAGRYRLTLKDAGVWETVEAQSTLFPKAGNAVELQRGLLGSYVAKIGRFRPVRVKRVE